MAPPSMVGRDGDNRATDEYIIYIIRFSGSAVLGRPKTALAHGGRAFLSPGCPMSVPDLCQLIETACRSVGWLLIFYAVSKAIPLLAERSPKIFAAVVTKLI